MRYRQRLPRSRPPGCLLGGVAGYVLVSLVWPHRVLHSDWVWMLGLLAGAVVGVLVQALVYRLVLVSARRGLVAGPPRRSR